MSITSDELNFLVYRYLQESGFVHSAFVFAYESLIGRSNIATADIPPGALIHFIQKGLQYVEIEKELEQSGQLEDAKKRQPLKQNGPANGDSTNPTTEEKSSDSMEIEKTKKKDGTSSSSGSVKAEGGGTDERAVEVVTETQVTNLTGHTSEVFACEWNPNADLLASGSGDSTVRIWSLPRGVSGKAVEEAANSDVLVLHHHKDKNVSKDVTTLHWNFDGTLLATGSYDGITRIWNTKGELQRDLQCHQGPIFSLKWNKKGSHLLSGSVDKSAVVWDVKTGAVKQKLTNHDAPTLDVDWQDDEFFATCSTDKLIHYCKVGTDKPLKTFKGHTDEVNAIKWSPSGDMLASCSDDTTAKIWSPQTGTCLFSLEEHTKEIYTIKWSPTGPGTANPSGPLILATASFDSNIKLWNARDGKCLHTLSKHKSPVYSVAFSPDGKYLASGSTDKCALVWEVATGRLVKSFEGGGGIFEVCWNSFGDKIAACFGNPSDRVCIIDFKK